MAILKRKLSGSTNGLPVLVVGTATGSANTIHTAVAGTTDGTYDEVWLWAENIHTANVVLTIEYGNATTTNNIIVTVPFKAGLLPILPGLILQNGATVKAFAATTNVVKLHGFVNSMTD